MSGFDDFYFAHRIAGDKYEPSFSDNVYKVHMKLTIRSVAISDYGTYKCISKNSLGETDGSIKLYREYKNAALFKLCPFFFFFSSSFSVPADERRVMRIRERSCSFLVLVGAHHAHFAICIVIRKLSFLLVLVQIKPWPVRYNVSN